MWLYLLLLCQLTAGYNIAIVGGGVGGASNAFFLKQLFHDDATIKVFERGEIGGRLSEVQIGGESYDSGGSIIHSDNFYAKALTENVGLKVEELAGGGGTGFYDGSQFVLKLTGSAFDKFKVLKRYGFGVKNAVNEGEKMIKNLRKIYCLQGKQVAFKTVIDLLNGTSPDFVVKAGRTMREELKLLGVSELIQDELVTAGLHCNYNQGLDVNAFVGFVSLAGGLVGNLWRVAGGNFQLPAKVLEKSGAQVLEQTTVTSISTAEHGYTVTYTSSNNIQHTEQFDSVVLATPLHDANITFSQDIGISAQDYQPFQRTVATFVNGILAPVVPGETNPGDILTVASKDHIGFASIGFKGNAKPDFNYKVFTKEPLSDTQLHNMFSRINHVKVVDWMAYPKYKVPDELPSFEIAPGLYYSNAIESAASAIEMSCIGSKNVALLVHQYLNKIEAGRGAGVKAEEVCRANDMKQFKEEL